MIGPIQMTWESIKEIGPYVLWTNNLQGSALNFVISELGQEPELESDFHYSQRGAERTIEDLILRRIKRKEETLLTNREKNALVKKIKNRFKEKK